MHISTKNLFKIEGELIPDKINKKYILKNIDKFDLNNVDHHNNNILMYIINYNSDYNLNFNKKEILSILNKVDCDNNNILMYIINYNHSHSLNFNKEEILSILDRFDLKQVDYLKTNILQLIIINNGSQKLGFNKEDILNILDKFDLNQKSIYGSSVYDYIIQADSIFDDKSLSFLIAKLDVEMADENGENILIKELKRGLCFDSDVLVEKILNTENKDIINCVYEHIEQIKWKQEELLVFISKNNLKFKKDIVNII